MSDDIVARLLRFRPVYDWPEETSTVVEKPLNQVAVDEITRLRADLAAVTAERDRMREALKPFAAQLDHPGNTYEHNGVRMALVNQDILDRLCRRARAALEGVTEPASPWRDIESAPKDGTPVVGCSTYKNKSGNLCYNWIADGYFDECGYWYFASFDFAECEYSEVTNWMPLPEPPR